MRPKIETGPRLWKKAKNLIPGGSQLLSKRTEIFLPDQWPSYYQKAKGVEMWDLDNNKFYDMSIMGVGACVLGYADDDVDSSVKKAIELGSLSTLNSPEEIELAELLLKIDNWAEMVRYARSGGEAMTIAVRIGRAYTKKDTIAFCGYHGWHDWYLSANLSDDSNLDGHLLPGLKPLGVPRVLKGTAIPFEYNRIDQLEEIVEKNEVGVIVLEPIRNYEPQNDFLQKVKKISDETGAVIIFDEITSGWRLNLGGAFKQYNVEPDIVVYGKAIANGYPMAAILGKREVMDIAQDSFISSTFWTERIGPTASIATINKMEEFDVPQYLTKMGKLIQTGLQKTSEENEVPLEITGIPPLTHFNFIDQSPSIAIRTLFTQEMLYRGFLASNAIYLSYSHNENIIEKYFEDVNEVFSFIKDNLEKKTINEALNGPIAHSSFKRLN